MPGRSIKIFLVDGTASGLRTAELGLSTLKAIVIPRASLSLAAKRAEVEKTGVYVLVGPDSENSGQLRVYIGEGDTIRKRLASHDRDATKDFWEQAVVFVSKDENLTKAHVRYLEARLIGLALAAKRATVENGTAPTEQGKLPEADEVEMEELIVQARLLLGTLGYDVFESIPTPTGTQEAGDGEPLSIHEFRHSGNGFSAVCIVDSESGQFIVKQGSVARKQEVTSLQKSYKRLREQLRENGVLVEHDEKSYKFSQNYAFSSITAAAQVVSGIGQNGRTVWKTKDGSQTFAEWQDSQIGEDESD